MKVWKHKDVTMADHAAKFLSKLIKVIFCYWQIMQNNVNYVYKENVQRLLL